MCVMQLRVVKGETDLVSVDIPGFPVRRWYCRICDIRVQHDKLSGDGAVLRKVSTTDERLGSSCCIQLWLLLLASIACLHFMCMQQHATRQVGSQLFGLHCRASQWGALPAKPGIRTLRGRRHHTSSTASVPVTLMMTHPSGGGLCLAFSDMRQICPVTAVTQRKLSNYWVDRSAGRPMKMRLSDGDQRTSRSRHKVAHYAWEHILQGFTWAAPGCTA
jgi:hypothetical protein